LHGFQQLAPLINLTTEAYGLMPLGFQQLPAKFLVPNNALRLAMGAEVSGRLSMDGIDGGLAAAITPAVLTQNFPAMNGGDAIKTTKVVEADPSCAVPHGPVKQTVLMVFITSRAASCQKQIPT
jgi:hypothetical protein